MDAGVMSNQRVIRPHLHWCGSRCFRVVGDFTCDNSKPVMIENTETFEMYEEYETEELSENIWNIKRIRDDYFEAALAVPSVCFGLICGPKNRTRSEIETSTHTRINIPGQGKSGNIVVSGASQHEVHRACLRIHLKVSEKRAKSWSTHFVCIPLSNPSIRDSFAKFKNDILTYPGIDELLLQNPMKIHLTMGMLTLLDDSEIEKAKHFLEEFTQTFTKSVTKRERLNIKLKGVEIMGDDPTAVRVLFGCVEQGSGKDTLEQIGNELMKALERCDLGSRIERSTSIKLHATLMNSKFKATKLESSQESTAFQTGGRTRDSKRDFSFDASKILENYKNFDFGCMSADRLRLSVCGSEGKDGAHQYVSEHQWAVGYLGDKKST